MKSLNNLRIRTKLIICFVIIALFVALVGYIGITNMGTFSRTADNIYTNNYLPSQKMAEIQKSIIQVRTEYLLLLYERNLSKFQEHVDNINNHAKFTNDTLAELEGTIKGEDQRVKQLFITLKNDLAAYREIRSENIELMRSGNYNEAISRDEALGTARTKVDTDLEAIIQNDLNQAKQDALNNASNYQTQSTVMIILVIASVLIAIGLGLFIANLISKPLNTLLKAANRIAEGDLNVDIAITGRDEVGQLAQAFSLMTENINEVMTNIASASDQVASGSQQVSESSMTLSQGATEQASSIEELTSSLEEISHQTQRNAHGANEANQIADIAKSNALQGNSQMQEMLKAMDGINESSSNISKIIKVIDEIAFQTNILALNAAVEAARAGQHGKGFAVVAEEVRNLAARSANAAKETTDMIEGSIKKVNDGTRIANETAAALNKIVEGVSKVSGLVGGIAQASNEQAAAITQINQGVLQVSQVVQNNSATSEESAAASEELASQAQFLKEQVERFKLKKNGRSYRGLDDIKPEVLRMLEREMEAKKATPKKALKEAATGSRTINLSDNDFGKY
ncbi:MAG: methyl-accepting chemotaxis protein [Clostridia bacterium]|nr:methyl-accepting chemotaxis protein [Clostridia bacterium]